MKKKVNKPYFIAIDWGTTNFRAFLLDEKARIIAKKFAHQGVIHQKTRAFEQVLHQEIDDWLSHYPPLPVLMSGMIGSRHGWVEVPYMHCPLKLSSLHQGLKAIPDQTSYYVVPGVRYDAEYGRVDVMRGEEVQILGALEPHLSEQLICLPGTHSKWAYVIDGQLVGFTSYMTGEIYMLLAKKSILSQLINAPEKDLRAFDRGLALADQDDSLLAQLFQVRTQVLAGKLASASAGSYLSGLLIGQELKQALEQKTIPEAIILIANPSIARLYARAFAHYKVHPRLKSVDTVTCKGLFEIAKAAGIV